jgi:hypothetical protein
MSRAVNVSNWYNIVRVKKKTAYFEFTQYMLLFKKKMDLDQNFLILPLAAYWFKQK